MGGVDRNGQLRGYYHIRLKCRKSYKYIFWFLFDFAVTNSCVLCKQYTDIKIDNLIAFRVSLATELIDDYCSRKRIGQPSIHPPVKRFCQEHFPVRGADKPHRCHYCNKVKKERHETVWYCRDCQKYLCHSGKEDDCFLLYHTEYGPEAED